MKKLSILKFGGGLLDKDGSNFPALLTLIRSYQQKDDIGPVVIFSALSGHTDKLIDLGNSYVHSQLVTSTSIFKSYENLAKKHVKGALLNQFLSELDGYKVRAEGTLVSIDKRFHGNKKAVFLTSGGELPTSALLKYVMLHNGLPAHSLPLSHWPIVTNDNFENATPLFNASQKRVTELITSLEEGEIIVLAGFLGITQDGLETLLGRGGSDLTAVFLSCLLKKHYHVETILVKDISVRSADPKIVPKEQTSYIASLSYNEANKASLMGMKIVQGSAISMARQFNQPIQIVPINSPEESTLISSQSSSQEIVKCVTGKSGCAILSINNEKSSSLSNAIQVWEGRDDFIELSVETLETGTRIRDFLFLDSEFLKKHEDRLKRFDNSLTIEYGVGVVTIIGDQMATASGVASLAISAIPNINIKRGIFAPRTSQIILVVDEKNVTKSVQSIHSKRNEMNLV